MQEESKQQLWLARLQERVASGQTVRTWCSHNDVTEASYYYWRKRLATGPATATQLIALPFTGGYGEPVLEVETPDGYLIRLRGEAQLGWLVAVVTALR